jgi:hypothetical protein
MWWLVAAVIVVLLVGCVVVDRRLHPDRKSLQAKHRDARYQAQHKSPDDGGAGFGGTGI